MFKTLFSLALPLFFPNTLFAQITLPQEAEIGTGKVSVRISTTGALINDFLVPNAAGDSSLSLLREVSLWMGGVDPGANMFIAAQKKDSVNAAFSGGFQGLPQSQGIWKVTKQQIKAHLADLSDNGQVDDPIPAIYAWPAFRNPFSLEYNGFNTDTLDEYVTAPFEDTNYDNIYNPEDGDYPTIENLTRNIRTPTEILYAPFHINIPPDGFFSNLPHIFDCSKVLYAYDCDDANFLEDAVFCCISSIHRATEPLASFYLAFYVDGNIGGATDDYLGSSSPYGDKAYFYNADSFDEGGFGYGSPMFVFDAYFLVLKDTDGWAVSPHSLMTIHPYFDMPPPPHGTDDPVDPIEYYRLMMGSWRDGTPLTFGGNGRGGAQETPFIFPGHPSNPNEWSEVSAQRPAGDRRALLSYGPVTLLPNAHNRSLFSLLHIPPNDISEQVATMYSYSNAHTHFFDVEYYPPYPTPFDSITCLQITTAAVYPPDRPVQIFPNPAHDQLTLQTEVAEIAALSLYNMVGTSELYQNYSNQQASTIQIDLKGIVPGIHLLQCVWKDGYRKTWKVVIE